MVKSKTIYEIGENLSLHLCTDGCYLLAVGVKINVTDKIEWGQHSRVLFLNLIDQVTEAAIIRAVYEFQHPKNIAEYAN